MKEGKMEGRKNCSPYPSGSNILLYGKEAGHHGLLSEAGTQGSLSLQSITGLQPRAPFPHPVYRGLDLGWGLRKCLMPWLLAKHNAQGETTSEDSGILWTKTGPVHLI